MTTDQELRSTILGILSAGDVTETQLLAKLQQADSSALPIHDQITYHAQVLTALNTLKFQHRVWLLGTGLWTITNRGKTSHA